MEKRSRFKVGIGKNIGKEIYLTSTGLEDSISSERVVVLDRTLHMMTTEMRGNLKTTLSVLFIGLIQNIGSGLHQSFLYKEGFDGRNPLFFHKIELHKSHSNSKPRGFCMSKLNVKDLPIAVNVCEQVLREVEKQPNWSMAHVIMNPMAESLLHEHRHMTEIYVITKGYGKLGFGTPEADGFYRQVVAGSVYEIPVGIPHMLCNNSIGHLEHLVFALPPFDPTDVHLLDENRLAENDVCPLSLPAVQECFDGAKIIPYAFPHLDLSIAFGWVINDPARRKRWHCHKKTTEFVFVVEGKGFIETNQGRQSIQAGNWIRIDPGTPHALINKSPEDMVVVCICSPAFQMEDVHYHQ